MIVVISPSKTQDFSSSNCLEYSVPRQIKHSESLINNLRSLNIEEVAALMKLSPKLAALNHQRYQEFKPPFNLENSKQALLAFRGDVYNGIEVNKYTRDEFNFAQQHLRILSGLYGVLRPLDLIQAYRLEMGTKLSNSSYKNLYSFWNTQITSLINTDAAEVSASVLVNLASAEYYCAIKQEKLKIKAINIVFKDKKNGEYKNIGIFAKRARGLMANFIIQNKLRAMEDIKGFNCNGYAYNCAFSTQTDWIFCR